METDISKRAVMILMSLVVIISALGTWQFLSMSQSQPERLTSNSGEVFLTVSDAQASSALTGDVLLQIGAPGVAQ